nr:zinc finger, CCHC-type [Tanacetum cinerariifolium]
MKSGLKTFGEKQEKTNTDGLVKEQEKVHHGVEVGAVIMKIRIPGQNDAKGNAAKKYREDSLEAAFAFAAVMKIYAHESLTFNDTVACEVIFKRKAGLKEDMDVWLNVNVLINGCRKSSDAIHDYY